MQQQQQQHFTCFTSTTVHIMTPPGALYSKRTAGASINSNSSSAHSARWRCAWEQGRREGKGKSFAALEYRGTFFFFRECSGIKFFFFEGVLEDQVERR